MGGFFSLLFLIDLRGFFHLGSVAAKNTGHVHPFKALFVRFRGWFLRFLMCRSTFRRFDFLYNRRRLSAMENSGRFHACFCFLFLALKLPWNWARGLSILQNAMFLGFCDSRFWL